MIPMDTQKLKRFDKMSVAIHPTFLFSNPILHVQKYYVESIFNIFSYGLLVRIGVAKAINILFRCFLFAIYCFDTLILKKL